MKKLTFRYSGWYFDERWNHHNLAHGLFFDLRRTIWEIGSTMKRGKNVFEGKTI
jgi:hypothetical protein